MMGPLGEKLRTLVEIPSPSSNLDGIRKVLILVKEDLLQLGFQIQEVFPKKDGNHAPILFAKKTCKNKNAKTITLVTHADTVFEPEHRFSGFKLSKDQKKATGPGVIDDKGGIVVAITGLKRFIEKENDPGFHLQMICTPTEELGSPGFQDFLKTLGQESWMALGFEPALESGDIIQTRRGNRWYRIEIKGQAAHSGRNPRDGVNAAHELAHKIVELEKINQTQSDIDIQTGIIQGGTKTNIVCAHAQASVDFRFPNFKVRDELDQKIRHLVLNPSLPKNRLGFSPSVQISLEDDCPPVETSDNQDQKWINLYLESLSRIENKTFRALPGGGAADVNYMSRPGLIIIDGLGPIGTGMHQTTETIDLESLETRSDALAHFLKIVSDELKKVKS